MINQNKSITKEDEMHYAITEFKESFFKQFNRVINFIFEPICKDKIHLEEIIHIARSLWATDQEVDISIRKYDLLTKKRHRAIVVYRQVVCHIARKQGYTLNAIGLKLNVDHSTVLYATATIDNLLKNKDFEVLRVYARINNKIIQQQDDNENPQINTGTKFDT